MKKDETAVPIELPAAEEARSGDYGIDNLLVDRVARFLTSHTLEFKIPKTDAEEFKRSLEEGKDIIFQSMINHYHMKINSIIVSRYQITLVYPRKSASIEILKILRHLSNNKL